MKINNYKKFIYLLIFLAGFFSRELGIQLTKQTKPEAPDLTPQAIFATVERVIDGDTLLLSNGQRIRLIGIDTPESYSSDKSKKESKKYQINEQQILLLGEQAKKFVQDLAAHKKVKLEFDHKLCDPFGRTLAYVYLQNEQQEIFLNAEILRQGFAHVMQKYPSIKKTEFQQLENVAQQQQIGLWQQGDFVKLSSMDSD